MHVINVKSILIKNTLGIAESELSSPLDDRLRDRMHSIVEIASADMGKPRT